MLFRSALVEAESEVRVAQAALLNAMGVDSMRPFEVRMAERKLPEAAEDDAEALALEHRQDYAAAALRTLAGKAEVRSAARGSSPSLSLRGGYLNIRFSKLSLHILGITGRLVCSSELALSLIGTDAQRRRDKRVLDVAVQVKDDVGKDLRAGTGVLISHVDVVAAIIKGVEVGCEIGRAHV